MTISEELYGIRDPVLDAYFLRVRAWNQPKRKPIDKLKKAIDHLSISQKSEFKPEPGEKPDENGDYWRTINGHKVRFRRGDIVEDNVREQVPKDRMSDGQDGKKEQGADKPLDSRDDPSSIMYRPLREFSVIRAKEKKFLKPEAILEMKAELERIPKSQLKNLRGGDIKIDKKAKASRGAFIGGHWNRITITVGKNQAGVAAVLRHEVQHLRWENERTDSEKSEWVEGIRALIKKHKGKTPTAYSDYYSDIAGPEAIEIREELQNQVKAIEEAINSDNIGVEHVSLSYAKAKKMLDDANEQLKTEKDATKREQLESDRSKLKSAMENIESKFSNASDVEKRRWANEVKDQVQKAIPPDADLFYNECHSEVGAFIYAEKSQREFGKAVGRPWINDDVIDDYVKLYKKVFKD